MSDAATLQNLLQLYTHDFSEHWAGGARGELGVDGRFADYPLDDFWRTPGWSAHLFVLADAPVGFGLVNTEPHSGIAVDHSMAELFVVRKHRGRGLGRIAAQRLFESQAGSWEVAVARKNIIALPFWRRAIATCSIARDAVETDVQGPSWNGPILRFVAH